MTPNWCGESQSWDSNPGPHVKGPSSVPLRRRSSSLVLPCKTLISSLRFNQKLRPTGWGLRPLPPARLLGSTSQSPIQRTLFLRPAPHCHLVVECEKHPSPTAPVCLKTLALRQRSGIETRTQGAIFWEIKDLILD